MLIEVKRFGRTKKHPKGVCEAAVVLWLQRFVEEGIDHANLLEPKDCDSLQEEVENGISSWSTLKGENSAITFDAFDDDKIIKLKCSDNPYINFFKTVNEFEVKSSEGVFFFFSIDKSHVALKEIEKEKEEENKKEEEKRRKDKTVAHALGIYYTKNNIYFLDPDKAIYQSNNYTDIVEFFIDNYGNWDNIIAVKGKREKQRIRVTATTDHKDKEKTVTVTYTQQEKS